MQYSVSLLQTGAVSARGFLRIKIITCDQFPFEHVQMKIVLMCKKGIQETRTRKQDLTSDETTFT